MPSLTELSRQTSEVRITVSTDKESMLTEEESGSDREKGGVYVCVRACVRACVRVCIHTYMYVCAYVRMCVCTL